MAKNNGEKGFLDVLKEDRYILIVAVAILIFIASSSIALMSPTPADTILPVASVTATVQNGFVSLSWAASATDEVMGYDVYRSDVSGQIGARIAQVGGLKYDDQATPGTYYYTIRAATASSDDGNRKQLKVVVTSIVPSGLSVSINNGARYAASKDVTLSLSAQDATECRYKNDDDPDWGAWEAYSSAKAWTLSAGGDGERIVAYQCRNNGESGIALVTITLDQNAPSIAYAITPLSGAVQLNLVVRDAVSPAAACTVFQDGSSADVAISLQGGSGSYVYTSAAASGEQHTFAVKCTDDAGNSKQTASQAVRVK